MIDNFRLIEPLLEFKSEDDFYFGQIIQRKKDNPSTSGTNNSARLIKAYYIKSIEQLEKQKEEMILLAEHYNARVCLNLNKRSFERTAFHTLKKMSDQIMNKDFKSVRRAYNSACGEYSNGDKRWLIDIDNTKEISPLMLATIDYECEPISNVKFDEVGLPVDLDSKLLAIIPTKSGVHLITKPFNMEKFKKKYPDINVHKNNPVNLYIPGK